MNSLNKITNKAYTKKAYTKKAYTKKTYTKKTYMRRNNRKDNTKTITKKRRSKMGGEALASGGFGCIFKPALKCKHISTRTNGVSKMSVKKHGIQEMKEINDIKEKLRKIKNYSEYYLLDIELCEPDKLTNNDMQHFDDKCYALTRYNITKKNVNDNLENLSILNMPDAGMDLKDWLLKEDNITREKIIQLNKMVVKLLKYGVVPMNKAGVIHNDLKDRNIMVDKKSNMRIIDWGLASIVKNKSIPEEIMNRPLQFNTPFSSMLLSQEFISNYNIFLQHVKKGTILLNDVNIRNFVINEYLIKINKYYGYYDDNVIVFNMIFGSSISDETHLTNENKQSLLEYGYYLYYLTKYIGEILMKYTTKTYDFEINKYFMDCYLFNSDVFGLMTVYYNFFEIDINKILLSNNVKTLFLNRVKSMLVEYIFSNSTEKINTKKLIHTIEGLSKELRSNNNLNLHSKYEMQSNSKSYTYNSKTRNNKTRNSKTRNSKTHNNKTHNKSKTIKKLASQ